MDRGREQMCMRNAAGAESISRGCHHPPRQHQHHPPRQQQHHRHANINTTATPTSTPPATPTSAPPATLTSTPPATPTSTPPATPTSTPPACPPAPPPLTSADGELEEGVQVMKLLCYEMMELERCSPMLLHLLTEPANVNALIKILTVKTEEVGVSLCLSV
ncbi:MAG: hypothetical protein WDW38_007959 [Sanguina aurantia]